MHKRQEPQVQSLNLKGWERSFGGGNGNPEKFHGQRTLVGHSPWGGKESDTAELTE